MKTLLLARGRWLGVLAALGAVLLATTPSTGGRAPATELLPDLDQRPPGDLAVAKAGAGYRLTFAAAVGNAGTGPLIVDGRRTSTRRSAMSAEQVARLSDGTTHLYTGAGRLRYADSRWQVGRLEGYELRRPSDYRLVLPTRESGVCLGHCGKDEPNLLTVREGISRGDSSLERGYIDVTDVTAGRYYLVHRANPSRALRELSYSNNAASLLIELRRPAGQIPRVEVVARCGDRDRCPAG
jgi:lysyl oxidase